MEYRGVGQTVYLILALHYEMEVYQGSDEEPDVQ